MHRGPALDEWYTTGRLGLEQGFTIRELPSHAAARDELVLEMAVDGLVAFDESEGKVGFRLPGDRGSPGALAHYGEAFASDATGKELPVRLSARNGDIRLGVPTADAVLPIKIDPLVWVQQQMITGDLGNSDLFGYSVAVSGDTAIVGAYSEDIGADAGIGAAYVFVRSGTTWSRQQKLTASDGAAADGFGISVAISGNTAVVGAYAVDISGVTNRGAAYVFVRSGTTWSPQGSRLIASDGAASDLFGYSVAISTDTAVIGAYSDDVGANVNQGSAYVFFRSGSAWSQQAKLTASDGAGSDSFGYSVAVSGNTALVGAPFDDGVGADSGSAYAFLRSGSSWSQQAKLTANDAAASDEFGYRVAVAGERALVGAPLQGTSDTGGGVRLPAHERGLGNAGEDRGHEPGVGVGRQLRARGRAYGRHGGDRRPGCDVHPRWDDLRIRASGGPVQHVELASGAERQRCRC